MAMGGKKVFDYVESQVKSGRFSREMATKIYHRYLYEHGNFNLPGQGWLSQEDMDGFGMVERDGEFMVQGIEARSESRDNRGQITIQRFTAVPRAVEYSAKKAARRKA